MYNNPYPINYPQYLQQQIQQLQSQVPQPQPQPQLQTQSQPTTQNGGLFYFVNNKQEAENWMVNAGHTVFFFDRNASTFYIKTVAPNGLSQPIEVYDYTQRTSAPQSDFKDEKPENDKYITRDEFDALKAQIEALEGELEKKEVIVSG